MFRVSVHENASKHSLDFEMDSLFMFLIHCGSFCVKIRNQTKDFYLALGLPDDSEVEINDVLGEDDNMTLS